MVVVVLESVAVVGDGDGVHAGFEIGAGVAVSDLTVVISSVVVVRAGKVASRACTAHLKASAFSCIDSGMGTLLFIHCFSIFWTTSSISSRL